MHGFALYQMMGKSDRVQVSRMAQRKSLDLIKEDKKTNCETLTWAHMEHISLKEKMQLSIYNKFKEILSREAA